MQPPENEPVPAALEAFLDDEERRLLDDPNVPAEIKAEIAERLERFRETDLEEEAGDAPLPE